MTSLVDYLSKNVGRCVVCMRQSFWFAIFSWGVSLLLLSTGQIQLFAVAMSVSALLLALWVTHLVVYAFRHTALVGASSELTLASVDTFARAFGFAASESMTIAPRVALDRFGNPVGDRPTLLEFKNGDGSRTAYFKTPDDIAALVVALRSAGYEGKLVDEGYWMSTDSCERSAGNRCSEHRCDSSTQTCRQMGTGMTYCRCS